MLLDNLIETQQFSNFIETLNDAVIRDIEYEAWLHKCFDKTFGEYQKSVHESTAQMNVDKETVKTTINKSKQMLSNFIPQ